MAERRTTEENNKDITYSPKRPAEIKDWDKEHVRDWILGLRDVDNSNAKILYDQQVNGQSLLLLEISAFLSIGIKLGPATLIIHYRNELKAQQLNISGGQTSRSCKPYPFNRYHAACRYKKNSILDITETGILNFIEPCHEYKAFINFQNIHEEKMLETKLKKFGDELLKFACACMNSRTNGTIHFGVGDLPDFSHGQILGTIVEDKEAFVMKLADVIEGHFENKHIDLAKECIKSPRFVEVFNADMTSSDKYVIEVDIEPSFLVCEDKLFHIYNVDTRKSKKSKIRQLGNDEQKSGKCFYIRDSSRSQNLCTQDFLEKYKKHTSIDNMAHLSKLRQEAEEKHLTGVKRSVQGSKLCEMITGGSQSLDKSHFERYILVINKAHPVQTKSLAFLQDMNLTAVLDFDPESAETGLNKLFEDRNTNVHSPLQYKITGSVEETVRKLKLTKITSWVFCNGGVNDETPSDVDNWLREKGSSVRDVVSFLCRKDVLPHKKFLIIFILLSDITDKHDPLLETFSMFFQELQGTEQILCICENERSFSSWKDLIEAQCRENISRRCISELSFAEINGTVLSLWSENRKSSKFLPGAGGKVLLSKKVEGTLDALNVLCVNQCEGGNEDKLQLEEMFYKGGKVSWWNFYFSEQPGSMPFIKRDKFDYIINTIIPGMCSRRQACVRLNILHIPGCGGTTLAMHVLWTVKEKFRCAILKNENVDYEDVAQQVVHLLTYETVDQKTRLPVMLLTDDFEDFDAVNELQQHIEKECQKKNLSSRSPQVILLNCMRADSRDQTEATDDTVFIRNKLSDLEQKLFETKLKEIEKVYKNAETFYGFMILKKGFSSEYIQGVVKNTLKGFNFKKKDAQLFAVLVLLSCYCKGAKVSVSICEEFLGLETRPVSTSCKAEDGFGKFSTLVTRCIAESSVEFQALRVIHTSIAEHCLTELKSTFNITKAQITDFLLITDAFYSCIQGKEKLVQDIRNMLVRRQYSAESGRADFQFSPLIQAIEKETPGYEGTVLVNATKRFEKDAVIYQLFARYNYLKKKDFKEAKVFAKKAKDLQRDNSYICDTTAQVFKHELKDAIRNHKGEEIKPDELKEYLKMAESATKAFKETQEIAKREVSLRYRAKNDFSPYNTAGRLGELQVAVMVIEILERMPMFPSDRVHHDILGQVLSGKMKIQDMKENDNKKQKNASYYHFLMEFTDLLYNLRDNMKKHFDFLDKYFVNLSSFYSKRDETRESCTREQIILCFKHYVDLFCRQDTKELQKNKKLSTMLKVEKTRDMLEKNKADSYSGLLTFLFKENSNALKDITDVICNYKFLLNNVPFEKQNERHFKDKVNFIFANIVLSKICPTSLLLESYMDLLNFFNDTLKFFSCTPLSDCIEFYFVTVMMLWPEPISLFSEEELSDRLGSYVSKMKSSFSNQMKPVCNGKKAVVHFYLGKETGYDRLITQRDIDTCVGFTQTVSGQLQNGKIWENEKVQNILCRVSGKIVKNGIMADTLNPNVKVAVSPLFKSQLCGDLGDRVSFFVGFSINGPVALGIQPE